MRLRRLGVFLHCLEMCICCRSFRCCLYDHQLAMWTDHASTFGNCDRCVVIVSSNHHRPHSTPAIPPHVHCVALLCYLQYMICKMEARTTGLDLDPVSVCVLLLRWLVLRQHRGIITVIRYASVVIKHMHFCQNRCHWAWGYAAFKALIGPEILVYGNQIESRQTALSHVAARAQTNALCACKYNTRNGD